MQRSIRSVPSHYVHGRRRARYREYARFYANYISMTGKKKRASFAVKVEPSLTNRAKHKLMVSVCNNILNKKIPQHVRGQIFHGFYALVRGTPWFGVRKILYYQAGMVYERG